MKKIIYSTLIFAAVLTSCGGSKKGAWSESDKEKFNAEIEKASSSLDAFGDQKQEFIDCYLNKVEANFDNFAEANSDVEGCSKYAQECAGEIMGM